MAWDPPLVLGSDLLLKKDGRTYSIQDEENSCLFNSTLAVIHSPRLTGITTNSKYTT